MDALSKLFYFRTCTDAQKMYQQLSAEVTKTSMDAAKKMITDLYTNCSTDESWEDGNSNQYEDCTKKISQSNARIIGNLQAIESFAAQNVNSKQEIQIYLGELMEDIEFGPYGSHGLETAINYIREESSSAAAVSCPHKIACAETTRFIIIQLKMIEWGIFGLGEGTAGMFLAHHYSKVGPFFGDMDGNEWPHTPLYKGPTPLENMFNSYMMQITAAVSGGKLKNISIIDLPAFGSKVVSFKGHQKKEPNWPIEVNFGIHNGDVPISTVFHEYKNLLSLWDKYMEDVYEADKLPIFHEDMKNNRYLNFTNYIREDMETYLKVLSGSMLSASKSSNASWGQIAKKVFLHVKEHDYVQRNGVYDKLVTGCSFKEDFAKKTIATADLEGGCEYFQPTLTTNGICHVFNGEDLTKIWKSSDVTTAFKNVFSMEPNQKREYFGGAGSSQGKMYFILINAQIRYCKVASKRTKDMFLNKD